jgi:hypothetical protein
MMAVKTGRAIPPRFLEPPPEVQMGLGIYMKAFFDLASTRADGNRMLPWTAIDRWCERMGLRAEDADDAHFLLVRIDLAYMEWMKSKRPAQTTVTPLPKKGDETLGNPTRVRR